MKNLKYKILLLNCLAFGIAIFSQSSISLSFLQNGKDSETPIHIHNEIKINASPEKTWDKIAIDFANIGDYHPNMDYSYIVDKTLRYGLNALRHCQIDDEKYIREYIVKWDEGNMIYTYRLYDSEGLSFMMKQCDFGIKIKNGETYLFHHLQYKMKSQRQTRWNKRKMKKENLELLRVYQNEIENDNSF